MIIKKRGEITSKEIIGLVLAIIGFVVVLILLWSLEFDSYSDEEACRLSVLSRATAPSSLQGSMPLKCTTKKICLAASKNDKCEQFLGEKDVVVVPMNLKEEEQAARIIERTVADSMYSCWTMMGEGKLQLFNGQNTKDFSEGIMGIVGDIFTGVKGKKETSCIICSRVALSKTVRSNENVMNKVDVKTYLSNFGPEGTSLTYLQIMTDGQMKTYPSEFTEKFKTASDSSTDKKADELAFIFMQIVVEGTPSEDFMNGFFHTGLTVGGGIIMSPLGKLVKSPAGLAVGLLATGGAAVTSGLVSYMNTQSSQDIASTHCGTYAGADGKYGCSLVKAINYDNIQSINGFCRYIFGNP